MKFTLKTLKYLHSISSARCTQKTRENVFIGAKETDFAHIYTQKKQEKFLGRWATKIFPVIRQIDNFEKSLIHRLSPE